MDVMSNLLSARVGKIFFVTISCIVCLSSHLLLYVGKQGQKKRYYDCSVSHLEITGSSRLMRISLVRISLLRFFKTFQKDLARNRLKIQFVELNFSKLIFQKSSTDEQGVIQFKAPCLSSQMIAVAEARRQGLIEFEKKSMLSKFCIFQIVQ